MVECLPHSTVPDELRDLGHHLIEAGEGQRILAHAVTQMLEVRADGTYGPLTEGSTKPVAISVTKPGIATVRRYSFRLA
jgi:hypothetical protein